MKSSTALTATNLMVSPPRYGEPVLRLLRQNHLLTALPLVIGASIEAPRRRRISERALLAINALWPDGVPSEIILPNCRPKRASLIENLNKFNRASSDDADTARK